MATTDSSNTQIISHEPEKQKRLSPMTLLCWLTVILLPLVWYWPRFTVATFSMIDDPADLSLMEDMQSNFLKWWNTQGFHGEPAIGRLRPIYWLARFIFYYLPFHFHPLGWNIVHYLNLTIVLSATFFLIKLISRKNSAAFLSCLLWIFSFSAIENYTRLATQDIWQILWLSLISLTAYFILDPAGKRRKPLLFSIFGLLTFFLYFTKETSVVLLPLAVLIFIMSLVSKKARKDCLLMLVINIVFFALQRYLAPPAVSYAANYKLQVWVALWKLNMQYYFIELQWHFLVAGAILSYLIRLLFASKKSAGRSIEYWQFCFLFLGFSFFCIYLPWGEHARRYLVVSDYFFALLIALELSFFINRLCLRNALIGLSAVGLGFFSTAQMPQVLRTVYTSSNVKGPVYALHWLAQQAPPNAKVLVLEFEMELLHSAIKYLHHFYNRKDIAIYSLSPFAREYARSEGNIVPIDQLSDPVMDTIDYVFWNHRGAGRERLDQFHEQLLYQMYHSRYALVLQRIYSDLPTGRNRYPEGTEIWRLNRS